MDNSLKNARIIKNSIILFLRMFFTLGVTLYVSRVLLENLGVEDFGIYNVVGGVVTMMAFLSGAMTSATQRFLSYELAKNNIDKLSKVFSMSINIHWLMLLLIIITAQTVGFWFVNSKLVITPERLSAANVVYQCAVFSFCCSVLSVPYGAAIIAHEKMNVFAYISVIEASSKLAMVLYIAFYEKDKLEIYSVIMAFISFLMLICNYVYSKISFEETRYKFLWDAKLFKTLVSFSGWSLFGNLSAVAANQGVNILLNLFFGVAINASRAIAFQINNAVTGFVTSLQMSINPQIVKSYATKNIAYMNQLITCGSKYTFFLLYVLTLPIFYQTEAVLDLWLVNPPEYAHLFCKLVLVDALITSLSGSLITAAQATGRIRLYQFIIGGALLLNLPISYLVLRYGADSTSVFYVSIAASILALILRLVMLRLMIGLDIRKFITDVIVKCIFVIISSNFFLFLCDLSVANGFFELLNVTLLLLVINLLVIYLFGLKSFERLFIKNFFQKKIRK